MIVVNGVNTRKGLQEPFIFSFKHCVYVYARLFEEAWGPDTWNHLESMLSVGGKECVPR